MEGLSLKYRNLPNVKLRWIIIGLIDLAVLIDLVAFSGTHLIALLLAFTR